MGLGDICFEFLREIGEGAGQILESVDDYRDPRWGYDPERIEVLRQACLPVVIAGEGKGRMTKEDYLRLVSVAFDILETEG